MHLFRWIALRYLIARRSMQFISVISILSLVGIIVGVAAIVCVSSIFNGFRDVYQSSMTAFDPHVRIEPVKGRFLSFDSTHARSLRTLPHVVAHSPVISGRIVLRKYNLFNVVQLHGVTPETFNKVSGVRNSIIVGEFLKTRDYSSADDEIPRISIGAELAMNAQVQLGDTVELLSPDFISQAVQSFIPPQGVAAIVGGIFYTNSKEYNATFGYCDLGVARRLFSAPVDSFTSVDVRVDDVQRSDDVASALRGTVKSVTVNTWYDLHADLYGVMRYERYASFIVLFIIVIVSVFNIFAMLSMTVVKKQRDIAVLMAMGATSRHIRSLFLWEGVIIGSSGTIIGTILGVTLCVLQQKFELFRFDAQTFIISAIPVSIAWPEVASITVLTVLSSFAATLYPATRASRTAISSAMRIE